ncbi:hypothetical protein BH11PLA2_BH11PLA2_06390 [soil metagenome]
MFATTLIIALSLNAPASTDWPQFRGPNATGVAAADAKPPVKWSPTEGVAWKAKLPGPGSSSPIVIGNRVFVTCYSGYGIDSASPGEPAKLTRHVVCLDRTTGKIEWTGDVPSRETEDDYRGYITEHGYASHTPASDGEAVYCFFGKSGVVAFNFKGQKLWQTSVGTESDIRKWGSSASPVLTKNLVIVNASSEGRCVVALDKKTGKEVWKAPGRKLSLSFGTPALVKTKDSEELVVTMPAEVWGLNPETGKLKWYATMKPDGNISPAVTPGDGIAYITGGFQTKGSLAIKTGGTDDVTKSNILWSVSKSSYVPTPVLYQGKLWNVTEDGMATVMNAETGALILEERLPSAGGGGRGSRPFYASPIIADGKLFAVSRKGGVHVLKADETLEPVQRNAALDSSDFNASPAIIGDCIYIRSNEAIYCLK